MSDPIEIYADTMARFSVSHDGSVAKLVFVSTRPNQAGVVSDVPVLILTMPASGTSAMINDIVGAVQQAKQATNQPKN